MVTIRRVALGLRVQDTVQRWARKEDVWRTQLRDADEGLCRAQEQCRKERDRVSRRPDRYVLVDISQWG